MVKCHLCSVKLSIMSENPSWDDEVVNTVRKYALQNSLEYGGRGEVGSVLGRILSEREDLRSLARELKGIVGKEVDEANEIAESKGLAHVRELLEKLAPDALERKKQEKSVGLKELPGDYSSLVLRFAPNPNGPLSLGHSRGVVINSEYAKMYGGKVVLRFDDTDTKVKPPIPDAYSWIEEEFEWISGRSADIVIRASDRMPIYLDYARKMIQDGHGYVCRCKSEEFREFRNLKEECPCRNKSIEGNIADWEEMNEGVIEEGGAVVRVKTEMTLPNPALRDWPALRIQHKPHPMVGDKYKVWPLLDFQSAIEDHEQGVTHIIRGKDLMDSTRKQTLLYEHFGWEYPVALYWGRVKVHEYGGFSTSSIREAIDSGSKEGWDDPRLPTIKALQRRGFCSDSLREFWIDLGLSQKDISIPLQTLESFNARIIDPKTERRVFVGDPSEILLEGELPTSDLRLPRHPENPKAGNRNWEVGGPVAIQSSDVGDGVVRLKDFADVKIVDEYANIESFEKSDERRIIHWLPLKNSRKARLVIPNGDEINELNGLLEDIDLVIGDVYQLERVGFARLDRFEEDFTAVLIWLHS